MTIQAKSIPLAVRMPNWVGDTIMALPALQSLANLGFDLQLFGRRWIVDLLCGTSYSLHALPANLMEGRRYLKNHAVQNILIFPNSFSSALMARLALKKSFGYRNDGRSIFLSKSFKYDFPPISFVKSYWDIARSTAIYLAKDRIWADPAPPVINLPLNPQRQQKAQEILAANGITEPYWIISPTAVGTGVGKQSKVWPHWVEFIQIVAEKGHRIVACPGPGEEEYCRTMMPDATIIPGIDLGTFAAIMASAQQIVANDSGPMHMAVGLNANVLGIFGVSDPIQTLPGKQCHIGQKGKWPSLAAVLERVKL